MGEWFRQRECCVYVARSIFEGQSAIKVGHAYDIEKRLKELKRAYKLPSVSLLFAIKLPRRVDAFYAEKGIHKQLAPYRIKGEWFKSEAFHSVAV